MRYRTRIKVLGWMMAGCVLSASAQSDANKAAQKSPEKLAIPVTAEPMASLVIYPKTRISATVVSLNHADISVEAAGVVRGISVEVGSAVNAGDELIQLDCRDAHYQRDLAQSAQSLTSKEWQRAKKLNLSQTIAEQQSNQAKAAFEQASVQLKQARLQVARCVLKAPYAGVVTKRYAQLGAYLLPGTPAVRLLEQGRVEGVASISSSQVAVLQQVESLVFEVGEQRYPVQFRVSQAFIDPATRQQEVRFSFSDASAMPLTGESGWLVWQNSQPHLPANLIVERGQEKGIFTVLDHQARFIPLAGVSLGHPVAVNMGQLKQSVVVEGRYRLADGDPVVVGD